MAKVWQDASYYTWALKFKYNRIRPYQLDTTLRQITNPNFPAYPSGHSANSYVAAYVYSELLPQFTELFSVCKKRLYAATGKHFRGKQLMNICG